MGHNPIKLSPFTLMMMKPFVLVSGKLQRVEFLTGTTRAHAGRMLTQLA